MKRKSIIISLLALLLVFPILAQAAPVGKFTSIEGNVDVAAPGKEAVRANLGDPLNVGDIIRTKSKSKCEVAFIDGSILRLAENSRLRVSEFTQEKEQRNATLNLFRGKIQNIVKTVTGAAAEQSKYDIHMPTAVCGVRGTNLFAFYQAGISGAIFKEGSGWGYALNRSEDVRTINAGEAMIVTDPDLPPVIRPATALELQQHEKDTAPGEKPVGGDAADALREGEIITGGEGVPTPTPPPPTPYVPPTVSGETNFTGEIYGGLSGGSGGSLIDGTFTARINSTTGLGTLSASACYDGEGTPTMLEGYIEGTSDKGGAFKGQLAGVQGSWLNRTSALYVEGGNIYFLAGDATGTLTESAYSMSGTFGKTAAVGTITLTPGEGQTLLAALYDALVWSDTSPQFFPSDTPFIISDSGIQIEPDYFDNVDEYLITNEGKKVEVIGNIYTGSYSPTGETSLPYFGYSWDSGGIREYALGPLSYSHDSTNHEFTVDMLLQSIRNDPDTEGWYIGTYSMRYLGMYEGDIFRMAGAGTYEGTPVAFGGEVNTPDGGSNHYYRDLMGSPGYGGWIGSGGTTDGIWGVTDSNSFLAMGEYSSPQDPEMDLFTANFISSEPAVGDGRSSYLFAGGTSKNDEIAASIAGLYAKPVDGGYELGFLTSSGSGNSLLTGTEEGGGEGEYNDTGIWMVPGDISVISMGTAVTLPEFSYPDYPDFSNDYLDLHNEYGSPDIAVGASMTRSNAFLNGSTAYDWGVWQTIAGGMWDTFTPPAAGTANINTAWTMVDEEETGDFPRLVTTYIVANTTWDGNDNKITGQAVVAESRVNQADPKTLVGVGEIKGLFDPVAKTWQSVSTGVWIETGKFLEMQDGKTTYDTANAALKALNIPAVQVGQATLTQVNPTSPVNNLTNVTMNNVGFFAYSSGNAPRIWATNSVTGNYSATPSTEGAAVTLSGGGLSASFGINYWQTGAWGANVTGSGSLSGGTYTGAVDFKGGAAGTFGENTFSGTAAGVVK